MAETALNQQLTINLLKQIDFLSNYVSIHIELSVQSKEYLMHYVNNMSTDDLQMMSYIFGVFI